MKFKRFLFFSALTVIFSAPVSLIGDTIGLLFGSLMLLKLSFVLALIFGLVSAVLFYTKILRIYNQPNRIFTSSQWHPIGRK